MPVAHHIGGTALVNECGPIRCFCTGNCDIDAVNLCTSPFPPPGHTRPDPGSRFVQWPFEQQAAIIGAQPSESLVCVEQPTVRPAKPATATAATTTLSRFTTINLLGMALGSAGHRICITLNTESSHRMSRTAESKQDSPVRTTVTGFESAVAEPVAEAEATYRWWPAR